MVIPSFYTSFLSNSLQFLLILLWQGHKQWLAEVQFLGVLEHPNLVKLLGYCAVDSARGAQRLLVYEFMPNKSLEDHLFRRANPPLSWNRRLQVILGAAEGLAYLHEGVEVQVIRCSSNMYYWSCAFNLPPKNSLSSMVSQWKSVLTSKSHPDYLAQRFQVANFFDISGKHGSIFKAMTCSHRSQFLF